MIPRTNKSRQAGSSAFTLLEVLLALFVFVVAVMALVESINLGGLASVESRMDRRVHDRMDALLLEITRQPNAVARDVPLEQLDITLKEQGVTYHLQSQLLELTNAEGHPVPNVYAVTVKAAWQDSGQVQEAEASTWVWPPLYAPLNRP